MKARESRVRSFVWMGLTFVDPRSGIKSPLIERPPPHSFWIAPPPILGNALAKVRTVGDTPTLMTDIVPNVALVVLMVVGVGVVVFAAYRQYKL